VGHLPFLLVSCFDEALCAGSKIAVNARGRNAAIPFLFRHQMIAEIPQGTFPHCGIASCFRHNKIF
jgi:hypothetical protein